MVALGSGEATWWLLAVAILALFCVHAGTDVINDVEDADRGVDDESKMDNSRACSPRDRCRFPTAGDGQRGFFAAAFALGTLIAIVQAQPWLFAIGIAGIAGGAGYLRPRPLKYAGLGDVAIVFLMGPLITQPRLYRGDRRDAFHAPAFWLGLAPGLLIASVLQANNLSDIPGDRRAGGTLAVRLGFGGGPRAVLRLADAHLRHRRGPRRRRPVRLASAARAAHPADQTPPNASSRPVRPTPRGTSASSIWRREPPSCTCCSTSC